MKAVFSRSTWVRRFPFGSSSSAHYYYYYYYYDYIRLTAFFQDNLGKLEPER